MTSDQQPLILASASPRRHRILTELGIPFEVVIPDAEEHLFAEDPERTARDNALLKNEWCQARRPDRRILSADTILDFDGKCLTKPESMEQAFAFLRMLSNRWHTVLTGVAYTCPGIDAAVSVTASRVHFRQLSENDIQNYFDIVDPMDKAGAYDIIDHGHAVIERIEGSRSNIAGLPVETVLNLLKPQSQE